MFVFLCIIIIFCIWLRYRINKHSNLNEDKSEEFWEKEYTSNFVRNASSIDYNTDLDFITIPLEQLPFMDTEEESLKSMQNQIKNLSVQKIANLSQFSNTDLKLKYGTASITALSSIDGNYTLLARILSNWGAYLYEHHFIQEALTVLEYGISIHTDVPCNYKTLALIYKEQGKIDQLNNLIDSAGSLTTLTKNSLVLFLSKLLEN